MRTHLEHPTQAYACGMPARNAAPVLPPEEFRRADSRCRRCERTLDAMVAGRPHYAGYDDGNGDRGARR